MLNKLKAMFVLCNTSLPPLSVFCLFCYLLVIITNFNLPKISSK